MRVSRGDTCFVHAHCFLLSRLHRALLMPGDTEVWWTECVRIQQDSKSCKVSVLTTELGGKPTDSLERLKMMT